MKICLVASSGGHLKELEFVKYLAIENAEYFLITEEIVGMKVKGYGRAYYVAQINRKEKGAWVKFLQLIVVGNKIIKKEKPDYYISTGALISIPILILGKLRGKKIIFAESFARVEDGSLSGKIAYRFSDLFIVYWKNLLKVYPKAVYVDPFGVEDDFCNSGNPEISV